MQSLFFWNDIYESTFEKRLCFIVAEGRQQPCKASLMAKFRASGLEISSNII